MIVSCGHTCGCARTTHRGFSFADCFLKLPLFWGVLLKTHRDFMPQFASVSSLGQHPALGQVPLDAKLEDISPISATEVGMC